ncbi:beta-glucosidase 12 [Phtheirospermum japonicum]|uniref:Beta-glucosidase 12 n=1 Tax=Phtheirospermum japonicum TaxID=374723 RepID=A0A830C9U8_9LAMI|nr:beta-glucosidase 12 [Phtheirospermum japonicum]
MCSVVFCAVLAVTLAAHHDDDVIKYCACDEASINRRAFPDKFIFGSASAAYQVEGGYNENGKGQTMWDNFTHTYPEKVQDHSNGDVAVDSYHLYKEDVELLKNMGVDAYKFSISWARILPGGSISKGVNQDGIEYYNNLINELLANGIQPWVTMFHLDTPQALEDAYDGFLSSRIVADFQDFADILFSQFGDRVKNWITINEPWCLSYLGYTIGVFAPARCSDWVQNDCLGGDSAVEPYKVTHNQLLAHAAVVKLYRDKYHDVQKGKIGITVNSFWFVPYDGTYESLQARDRAFDFMLGWIMDPITFGRYPKSMRTRIGDRLPEFTKEEAEMVKGSVDFLGLNYYSAKYAINIDEPQPDRVSYITDSGYFSTGLKDGIPIGEQGSNGSRYYSYPMGLRGMLKYIKLKYNDPLIYVTENGFDENTNDSLPMSEAIKDYKRKKYLLDHLCCLREAIEQDGANVKGYFAWSLTDNFEWVSGYLVRFGLHYVDFRDKSLARHPKLSAQWLTSVFGGTIGKYETGKFAYE